MALAQDIDALRRRLAETRIEIQTVREQLAGLSRSSPQATHAIRHLAALQRMQQSRYKVLQALGVDPNEDPTA